MLRRRYLSRWNNHDNGPGRVGRVERSAPRQMQLARRLRFDEYS